MTRARRKRRHKFRATYGGRTDIGQTRSENQDALNKVQTADGLDVFVVCDGMGGHAGGRTASQLAVEAIITYCDESEEPARERLNGALDRANMSVYTRAAEDPELRGMGTTAVVLLLDPDNQTAHVAHVGDSRIYRARGDQIRQLTRDHTIVQQLVYDGILSDEQAHGHPHANVISRSLGGKPMVYVDHGESPHSLETGDMFLLCSDGLSGCVEGDVLAELMWANHPKDAADSLISVANDNGGEDNITAQVVLVGKKPRGRPKSVTLVTPGPPREGTNDGVGDPSYQHKRAPTGPTLNLSAVAAQKAAAVKAHRADMTRAVGGDAADAETDDIAESEPTLQVEDQPAEDGSQSGGLIAEPAESEPEKSADSAAESATPAGSEPADPEQDVDPLGDTDPNFGAAEGESSDNDDADTETAAEQSSRGRETNKRRHTTDEAVVESVSAFAAVFFGLFIGLLTFLALMLAG